MTQESLKSADGYIRKYQQQIKDIHNDASKDDLKKLIARLQTLNKLDQVQQIETGHSQADQPKNVLNNQLKSKQFTPLFYNGNIKDTKKLLKEFKPQYSKEIEHVFLVGFHHIVGSQVEFIYPPLDEDQKEVITPNFLQKIAQQALPDGSHLTTFGQVYFILHDETSLFHCVSRTDKLRPQNCHKRIRYPVHLFKKPFV